MRKAFYYAVLLCGSSVLFGQGATLVDAGYDLPALITVAPGQIITLTFSGVTPILPPSSRFQEASTIPLPTSMAGLSLTMNQGASSFPVPIISIRQFNICGNSAMSAECFLTRLTVQIPNELAFPSPLFAITVTADLVVQVDRVASKSFTLAVAVDAIHVVTRCGTFPFIGAIEPNSCRTIVAHADGNVVTASYPATNTETVVIYAYGLGPTTPSVKSGEPSPIPASVLFSPYQFFDPSNPIIGLTLTRTVLLDFNFHPNAGPSRPYLNPKLGFVIPEFVGLTPGQVGLYQINVKLPNTFPPVEPCTVAATSSLNTVQSNLTINIGGVSSFDGAAICVQPIQ